MRRRLVLAGIEMASAILIFLIVIGIDLTRQSARDPASVALALMFTASLMFPLLLTAGQRLHRTLAGREDPRRYPPTAVGMIGVLVVALAVLAALAPALIQL